MYGRFAIVLSVFSFRFEIVLLEYTFQASKHFTSLFYETFRSTIARIHRVEKAIILGDFNTRIRKDHKTREENGPFGKGKVSSNRLSLLEFCSKFNLSIYNSFFHQKLKHKEKLYRPRSKHKHVIDFVLTCKQDFSDVCCVRVPRSADCNVSKLA